MSERWLQLLPEITSSGALFRFEYSCPSYTIKESAMEETAKCPYTGAKLADEGTYTRDWWPEQLNLKVLHQNSSLADPMDKKFNYAKEFKISNLVTFSSTSSWSRWLRGKMSSLRQAS